MRERRPCACRGWIEVADAYDEAAVGHALRVHYRQPDHANWRRWTELLEERMTAVNVPLGPRATLRRLA